VSGARRTEAARPPRLPERTLWVDGRLCRGADAAISLFDRGARDGAGLFETMRAYAGRPFLWDRHLERMVLAAAEIGFPVPPSPVVLRAALDELLAAENLSDAVVRVTVTRGVPGSRPTRAGCWIEAEPVAGRLWRGTRSGRARVVISKRPFEPGPFGRYKTTSRLAYHMAFEEARAAGADEALLVDATGRVLEGSASNLFAVKDGLVLTPALRLGILPGVTRARVLELCRELGIAASEASLDRAALLAADELFLTNSVQEVVPVGHLGEHAVPDGAVGTRLREAYRAAVATAIGSG
jgi:branched-chain amino acid aminotransferase